MKLALTALGTALVRATSATAGGLYTNDTVMTRNVPAAHILNGRDQIDVNNGTFTVTIGKQVIVDEKDYLTPAEIARDDDDTTRVYVFKSAAADTALTGANIR